MSTDARMSGAEKYNAYNGMNQTSKMAAGSVAMLASVRDAHEAKLCVSAGVDFIDAKEPRRGALGAVSLKTLRSIRDVVPAHIPLSATLGDDVCEAVKIAAAAHASAQAGADIIKVGLFSGVNIVATLNMLEQQNLPPERVVVVLLVDRDPDFSVIATLADAGIYGVMLDTVNKTAGGLLGCLSLAHLAEFIQIAQGLGLRAGLAGGLTLQDLPRILSCGPDIVGFRGALSALQDRTTELDRKALNDIRAAVPRLEATRPVTVNY